MSKKARLKSTLLDSPIAWASIPKKGRGIFTARPIKKGAIIETAPVIPMAKRHVPAGSAADGYVLEWDAKNKNKAYAMVLGYIMLYNHSDDPNMTLETDLKAGTVTAQAIRDIRAGEELTWDYDCELWFSPA
jgi:SET domain-containing protein